MCYFQCYRSKVSVQWPNNFEKSKVTETSASQYMYVLTKYDLYILYFLGLIHLYKVKRYKKSKH